MKSDLEKQPKVGYDNPPEHREATEDELWSAMAKVKSDSGETATFTLGDAPLYTQADLDRLEARLLGTQYQKFLAEHDECVECGNAACRGTELFPMRINGKAEARCWGCLNLTESQPPAEALGADEVARQILADLVPSNARFASFDLRSYQVNLIAAAIHAAEQRVRREDAECAKDFYEMFNVDFQAKYKATPDDELWEVLASLGEPKREK